MAIPKSFESEEAAKVALAIVYEAAEKTGYQLGESGVFVWPQYAYWCHGCGREDTFNSIEGTCYNYECEEASNQPIMGWGLFSVQIIKPLTQEDIEKNIAWEKLWKEADRLYDLRHPIPKKQEVIDNM